MSACGYVETAARLDYNPETGELLWKYDSNMPNWWNGKLAGKRAGTASPTGGRIVVKSGGVAYCLMTRRIAWLLTYGDLPEVVITKDGNPNNDAVSNLSASTLAEGSKKAKISVANKTGTTGVSYRKSRDKYFACVRHNGSTKGNSKLCNTLDEAEIWVKAKQIELGFDPDLHGRL